jgi:hypothetical protein
MEIKVMVFVFNESHDLFAFIYKINAGLIRHYPKERFANAWHRQTDFKGDSSGEISTD